MMNDSERLRSSQVPVRVHTKLLGLQGCPHRLSGRSHARSDGGSAVPRGERRRRAAIIESYVGAAAALPAPTPAVTPVSGPPDFVAGAQGVRQGEPLDTVVQTNQQVIPGQAEGQQGIMFPPEQTTAAELNRLSEQPTAGEVLADVQQANAQPTQAEL